MMQSAEEHQDVVSEDVAVLPVQALEKRHRGRKSTAERHGEQEKGTRGYYASRGKVTVADRMTSRHATVAWLKRNLFRRSGTHEFCGQQKELTAAGIRKIPRAQVVRGKRRSDEGLSVEQRTRNNKTRNKFQEGPEKDVSSEEDNRWARKAPMQRGTEALKSSYVLEK
jgi:hypothetical protein